MSNVSGFNPNIGGVDSVSQTPESQKPTKTSVSDVDKNASLVAAEIMRVKVSPLSLTRVAYMKIMNQEIDTVKKNLVDDQEKIKNFVGGVVKFKNKAAQLKDIYEELTNPTSKTNCSNLKKKLDGVGLGDNHSFTVNGHTMKVGDLKKMLEDLAEIEQQGVQAGSIPLEDQVKITNLNSKLEALNGEIKKLEADRQQIEGKIAEKDKQIKGLDRRKFANDIRLAIVAIDRLNEELDKIDDQWLAKQSERDSLQLELNELTSKDK